MASRILGSGIKRREDPRLITGQAKYTDDFALPGMVYMSVVRSPYGHARINAVADALSPLGVKTINMPLTPERVWRAIREARS